MRRPSDIPTTGDLFAMEGSEAGVEPLGSHACVLRRHALPWLDRLLPALQQVIEQAPFRHMMTPGGLPMSAALTSCGHYGWVTDRHGYRYAAEDPLDGQPWPAMPAVFRQLAEDAAARGGFPGFDPDACLINQYLPGARMSLHQDRDEHDLRWPVVSVSLGLPAVFLFGGMHRADPTRKVALMHGDVVVWGGVDRLRFHGIQPVKPGEHPQLGAQRINFTFRRAF